MRCLISLPAVLAMAVACSTPVSPTTSTSTTTSTTTSGASALPSMYNQFGSSVTVTLSGAQVVLKSNGVPDHTSPYWGVGNALYEAPQSGMIVNPNVITAQS